MAQHCVISIPTFYCYALFPNQVLFHWPLTNLSHVFLVRPLQALVCSSWSNRTHEADTFVVAVHHGAQRESKAQNGHSQGVGHVQRVVVPPGYRAGRPTGLQVIPGGKIPDAIKILPPRGSIPIRIPRLRSKSWGWV